jgi:TRAP-type C4-dicarboxylate transport system permease small subunit
MSEQNNDNNRFVKANKKAGRGISAFVDRFETTIILVSTAALAILSFANVVARTVYRSFYFTEELSQFFIMMLTFIGTSYAARKARHIRMGALLEAFPPKLEKVMIYIISATSAVVMFVMAYFSFEYMMALKGRGTSTASMGAPYWIFIIIAPIGLFMAGFQYVRTIIKNINEKETWLSAEQQSEYEEEEAMMQEAVMDIESVEIKLKEDK